MLTIESFAKTAGIAILLLASLPNVATAQDKPPATIEGVSDALSDVLIPLLPEYHIDDISYESESEKLEMETAIAEANSHNASLSPETGTINLRKAGVTMDMGDNYYFLKPKDSQKILGDLWGNPANPDVLGMIFQRGTDGYSNDYAVAVYFEPVGYVSDEDASTIDYDDLLKDMKDQTRDEAAARRAEGYEGMDMVGWGADPKYDAQNHTLSWAPLLKFDSAETNTLNYNMRFLGRKGVLEFRYIADEEALPILNEAIPAMADLAAFNPGHRYSDFDPKTDKVAAYGLAGLVAGGAVAKKLGLMGFLILFLKKGWIIIIAALAFGRRFISGFFGRKSQSSDV